MSAGGRAGYALRCATPRPDARHRLVCFPYAGGGPHTYRTWDRHLEEAEVWTIALPGHVGRLDEPFARSLGELGAVVANEIRTTLDDEAPPVLFGHSMGAWLAFEVARNLESAGRRVAALVVSGRSGPGYRADTDVITHLDDDAFARELDRRYGGLPAPVLNSPEIMELFLPMLRADIAMMERYRPTPGRVACSIHALGGADDSSTPREGLAAWASSTASRCATALFPGGHFYLEGAPHALISYLAGVLGDP